MRTVSDTDRHGDEGATTQSHHLKQFQKTAAAGLNIYQLAQQLGGDNFTLASGTVMDGNRKLLLRSVARFDDLEALQNLLVGSNTRLGEIADITYEQPERDFRVRAMSRPAVAVVARATAGKEVGQVSTIP